MHSQITSNTVMERAKSFKEKEKKGIIIKTLERCKSLGNKRSSGSRNGCVTVYVGSDKEKFTIRMDCLNHPLFKELLDEAESVYGYTFPGPVRLPCEVDRFERVLWEIDECKDRQVSSQLCSFPSTPRNRFSIGNVGYRSLNLNRLLVVGRN